MSAVVTLISPRARPALSHNLAEQVAALVGGTVDWLQPEVACDIRIESRPIPIIKALLGVLMTDTGVDCVVQELAGRRKRILVADMDSTMIGQECIDELADMIGLKDKVAAITARAMNGEIAFEPALIERVKLLAGLPVGVVARVINERLTYAEGGRELVATMRAHKGYTALVSGGFTAFTSAVAAKLGFHTNRANRLGVANGRLTGEVEQPILGREAKVEALQEIAAQLGLTPADAIAVGDGANDLGMIGVAGTGVAIHAKPAVAAAAPHRIDHADLTALLFLQGYRASEFVR